MLAAAPITSAPDLTAASDSGWSSTDNKTSVVMPTFTGTASNAASVSLYDGRTLLGSTPVVDGAWSFTAQSPLANGRHSISARALALGAAQPGRASKPLVVTVNTAAPQATTIALAAASNGGSKSDGITNVAAPWLVGRGQPGTIIGFTAVRGEIATNLGAVAVPTTGSWRFRLATPLADGSYTVTTSIENVFGSRTTGATRELTIDTAQPVATIAEFGGIDTITLSFTKPVSGVALRNLWISGRSRDLGQVPMLSLADPRVRSFLGGPVTIVPAGGGPQQTFTVRLPIAFAEPGTFTLTLLTAGISDSAGNRPASTAVTVTVA